MIVECITKPWKDVVGRDVTVGNHYKVAETNYDDEYLLIDDTGYQWWYCASHFKEIEEKDIPLSLTRRDLYINLIDFMNKNYLKKELDADMVVDDYIANNKLKTK